VLCLAVCLTIGKESLMKRCNRCYKLYENSVTECPDCHCALMSVPDSLKDMETQPPEDIVTDFALSENLKENLDAHPFLSGIKGLRPADYGRAFETPSEEDDEPKPQEPPPQIIVVFPSDKTGAVSPLPDKGSPDYRMLPPLETKSLQPKQMPSEPDEKYQKIAGKYVFTARQFRLGVLWEMTAIAVLAVMFVLSWKIIQDVFISQAICFLVISLVMLVLSQSISGKRAEYLVNGLLSGCVICGYQLFNGQVPDVWGAGLSAVYLVLICLLYRHHLEKIIGGNL